VRNQLTIRQTDENGRCHRMAATIFIELAGYRISR